MADKVINPQQGQSVAPATPPAAWSFLMRKKPPQHAVNKRGSKWGKMLRFLVLTLLACAAAEGVRYCCTPPQWESFNTILSNRLYNTTSITIMMTQRYSEDGDAKLLAYTTNITVNRVTTPIRVIEDFANAKSYIIRNKTCQVHTLSAWHPTCIPDDAQLLASTYYGLGNNTVDVNTYGFSVDDGPLFLTVSRQDCLPLYGATYHIQGIDYEMTVKTYSNVTLGIKDRSVFIVPDFCRGQPLILHPAPKSARQFL